MRALLLNSAQILQIRAQTGDRQEIFSGMGLVLGLLRSTLGSEANGGLLIRRRSSSLQSTVMKHQDSNVIVF